MSQTKPDLKWDALTPTIITTSLATAVVALRLFTRWKLVKAGGFDDCVIIISTLLSWTVLSLLVIMIHHGFGTYTWLSDLDLHSTTAKLFMSWNVLYLVLLYVTKASILTQYLRIFTTKKMRRATWVLMACLVPAVLGSLLGGVLICDPVRKVWNHGTPGTCSSTRTYWLSTTSVNIVFDFAVLVLPMPAIAKLRLPRRQKYLLVGVFLLGFFTCAVSLARVALVHNAYVHHNFTESSAEAVTWSMVEANTGIICASLLALKPLIIWLFPVAGEVDGPPRWSMTLNHIEPDVPDMVEKGQVDRVEGGRAEGKEIKEMEELKRMDSTVDGLTLVGTKQSDGGEVKRVQSWSEETMLEMGVAVSRPETVVLSPSRVEHLEEDKEEEISRCYRG